MITILGSGFASSSVAVLEGIREVGLAPEEGVVMVTKPEMLVFIEDEPAVEVSVITTSTCVSF
jgi:hypothetical protein